MEIRWLGHSCFELSDGDARVVIDPFLKPNSPTAPVTAEEVDATHILLSHGHADHVADAVALATRTGAPCVAIVELAKWLDARGVEQTFDPNLGGVVEFEWGWVKLVQAFHTNTTPSGEEGHEPFSAETGTSIGVVWGARRRGGRSSTTGPWRGPSLPSARRSRRIRTAPALIVAPFASGVASDPTRWPSTIVGLPSPSASMATTPSSVSASCSGAIVGQGIRQRIGYVRCPVRSRHRDVVRAFRGGLSRRGLCCLTLHGALLCFGLTAFHRR